MLKSGLIFVASLVAVLSMGSAYATDPADTADTADTVATEHAVYTTASNTGTATTLNAESGIAGVTYVNRMVNVAGNAAQKAEDHAAAAGKSALDAATAAANAQTAAERAQTTANNVANKQDKSTAVTHGANTGVGSANRPVYVSSDGAATAVTGISVPVGAATATSGTTWASIWVE